MALPEQIGAYEDCIRLYDEALADPIGARTWFPDNSAAMYFRTRMNNARVILRKESMRLYDRTDHRYNKSDFDKLVCRIKEDTDGVFWVYVERHAATLNDIEPLSEVEPPAAIEYTPYKLLSAPDKDDLP